MSEIDRVEQIKLMGVTDPEEAILMILGGHCTHGSASGALLHVCSFPKAAQDIIRFFDLNETESSKAAIAKARGEG